MTITAAVELKNPMPMLPTEDVETALGPDFYAQLELARHKATNINNYSSAETQNCIISGIWTRSGGITLYDWQVDVSEAVYLGLDVALMAGTGAGKTWTFLGILLAEETGKSKVVVVSPLNELQKDQVSTKFPCTCNF
jgi:superfamily II DNA or RNA helicase